MSRKLDGLSRRYLVVLRKHLQQGSSASAQPARALGRRALALGLETLDMARFHEQALIPLLLPGGSPALRDRMIRRAGKFFAEAITPIEQTHRAAREANGQLVELNQTLHRRSVDLTASNRRLQQEVFQRKAAEESLRKSEQHYSQLLEQSRLLQEQLRLLSRQLLLAQEEERKRISRELHDQIAQTLTAINVRLAALKTEATCNTKGLQNKIASTQRMVEKSVDIVHRFARELRPTVLDDLGLIPALHSFVKNFSKEARIHVRLAVYAGVEQLDSVQRTVLYRVAQEALTNVARHAHASRAEVSIKKTHDRVCMTIKDDGKSFDVDRVLRSKGNGRLGLLGMRERLEMVGGNLVVESAPRQGTTVHAQIPLGPACARGAKLADGLGATKNSYSMKRITVLLAEDHMVVREGFRKMLELEQDLEVVGEAEDGRQAVALVKKLRPAVVLMDIAMPQLNGLEATRQVLKAVPSTKVLILSAHSDDAYVENATAVGAMGFLLKQTSSHVVCEAIREVHKGNVFFSPTVARRLQQLEVKWLDRVGMSPSGQVRLTSREMEVLQLIAEGKANKQIATELSISSKTVEKHREKVMSKLGIHDTAGLTRYAIGAGIIESSVQLTVL